MSDSVKRPLTILLAAPRGFCAGVDRAIKIVEVALEEYGAPVFVRHEIVHNKFVVDGLREKGAIFVDELDEIKAQYPEHWKKRPVIFSAHGVAKEVPEEADSHNITWVDATCPLVSKVHRAAERHFKYGSHIILIGHAGHAEVIGTMGQLPPGAMTLVETVDDVATLSFDEDVKLAYCTQTTLSVADAAEIIAALKAKFPEIQEPKKEDICYATTNRQAAVREIAERSDGILVIGAPNSSNSNRLVEEAKRNGCDKSLLVQRASEIDWDWFDGVDVLGLSAGASAPEELIEEVVDAARKRFDVSREEVTVAQEGIEFKLPKFPTLTA